VCRREVYIIKMAERRRKAATGRTFFKNHPKKELKAAAAAPAESDA
jgi:hypothetical protein